MPYKSDKQRRKIWAMRHRGELPFPLEGAHLRKLKELEKKAEGTMDFQTAFIDELNKLGKYWMQDVAEDIKRKGTKGALSRKLGVPENKNIPAEKLKVKKGDTLKTIRQKTLAKTFKKAAKNR